MSPLKNGFGYKSNGGIASLGDGSRGIASGHAPFIGRLGAGEVKLLGVAGGNGGETTIRTFIDGGFTEVGNNEVTVITQHASDSGSIDPVEAKAELAQLCKQKAVGDEQINVLLSAESTARARLRAAQKNKK